MSKDGGELEIDLNDDDLGLTNEALLNEGDGQGGDQMDVEMELEGDNSLGTGESSIGSGSAGTSVIIGSSATTTTSNTESKEDVKIPRPKAVHLIGVNDLSSDEVEKYVGYYYPRIKYRVQWVDDQSLNMVFDTEEQANDCLDALTSEAAYYDESTITRTEERPAKSYPFKDGVILAIRQAFESDRKVKGARARSRYYLFHGEPTREEDELRFSLNDDPESEERIAAKQNRYKIISDNSKGADLFPSKIPTNPLQPGSNSLVRERRLREQGELFPDKVISNKFRAGLSAAGLLETPNEEKSELKHVYRERDLFDIMPGGKELIQKNPSLRRNEKGKGRDRTRSRSPISDSNRSRDFADRLDTPWIKGDLLEKQQKEDDNNSRRRGRKNRRRAADLF